ncbi:hypothetical protein J5226_08105 [Lysobacter sp. K5869]|nr:hypothetical protein J5226_08105 [Lysobacter sp. K5869]
MVEAARLTDFDWRQLCFERAQQLELKFADAGRSMRFDPETYFVAEPYVEGSPDGRCIGRDGRLLLKRKYPGVKDTVEFQLAPAP